MKIIIEIPDDEAYRKIADVGYDSESTTVYEYLVAWIEAICKAHNFQIRGVDKE